MHALLKKGGKPPFFFVYFQIRRQSDCEIFTIFQKAELPEAARLKRQESG